MKKKARRKKPRLKRGKAVPRLGRPIVAVAAWRIARALKRAGVSRKQLFAGLKEERAKLYQERYSDHTGGGDE